MDVTVASHVHLVEMDIPPSNGAFRKAKQFWRGLCPDV